MEVPQQEKFEKREDPNSDLYELEEDELRDVLERVRQTLDSSEGNETDRQEINDLTERHDLAQQLLIRITR